MTCERCGREVHGDILTDTFTLPDGTWVVAQTATPDRDWICCDACNALLCHECCTYPVSGYCDVCITEYDLYDFLVERGVIERKEMMKSNVTRKSV
jgi:hypothetical protein